MVFKPGLVCRCTLLPVAALLLAVPASAQGDPLPSWHGGPVKRSMLELLRHRAPIVSAPRSSPAAAALTPQPWASGRTMQRKPR